MTIHPEHPFATPPSERDPARRLRGRLASAVTIITSGEGDGITGLTVSSLFVVEGNPPLITALVTPNSDLWDAAPDHGGFVVHVCAGADRALADVFAGLRPSPGGAFSGLDWRPGPRGPVLEALADRAHCRFVDREET